MPRHPNDPPDPIRTLPAKATRKRNSAAKFEARAVRLRTEAAECDRLFAEDRARKASESNVQQSVSA